MMKLTGKKIDFLIRISLDYDNSNHRSNTDYYIIQVHSINFIYVHFHRVSENSENVRGTRRRIWITDSVRTVLRDKDADEDIKMTSGYDTRESQGNLTNVSSDSPRK